MPLTDMEAEFEDLWDEMERLAKSGNEAERKRSCDIARDLVSYTDLPRSYRIRAHMALASLVCPQDALHEAKKKHAKIHDKVSSELQIMRKAYKNKGTEEGVVGEGDGPAEDASPYTFTITAQLQPGSQEEPIDLTVEDGNQDQPIDLTVDHDSGYFENTSSIIRANRDDNHVEGTEVLSTGFSLWPRYKVISLIHPRMRPLLTALSALLFIHPPTVHSVPTPMMTMIVNKADFCGGHQIRGRYGTLQHPVLNTQIKPSSTATMSTSSGA